MATDENDGELFFIKPPEVATGRVVITPDGPLPYKVVFRLGDRVVAEHVVSTVREGEALIRREVAEIQFAARDKRPDPQAPKRARPSVVK